MATAIAAIAASVSVAAPASASETPVPSVAAQIAHAEFLPYMDPPPGEPATVCLVDTGVDLNPDTVSTVVEREALDGGDPGDVWDKKHGTEMAMVMGAPINDWGTVGAWPLVRIISVRAMAPGATSFPFSAYAKAIQACLDTHRVRVINLSFSGNRPTDREVAGLDEYAARARRAGMAIVAGAGNGGAAVEWPAADPYVVAISATDRQHVLCGFSGRGPAVLLAAPGCGLEIADAFTGSPVSYAGTSPAASFFSAALAAVLSYRPTLSPEEAEQLLVSTTSTGTLDVEAAFRAAGLGSAVDVALSRVPPSDLSTGDIKDAPAEQSTGPSSALPDKDSQSVRWPALYAGTRDRPAWRRPRIARFSCDTRGLALRVKGLSQDAALRLRVYDKRREFGLLRSAVLRTSSLVIRRPGDLVTVQVVGAGRRPSAVVRVTCRGRKA